MKNLENLRVAVTVTFACSVIALYPATPPEIEIIRQRIIIPVRDGEF